MLTIGTIEYVVDLAVISGTLIAVSVVAGIICGMLTYNVGAGMKVTIDPMRGESYVFKNYVMFFKDKTFSSALSGWELTGYFQWKVNLVMNNFLQLLIISVALLLLLTYTEKKTNFRRVITDALRKKLWLKIVFLAIYIGICFSILFVDNNSEFKIVFPILLVLLGFILFPSKTR